MSPRLSLCPQCGSHEVESDRMTPLGQRYDCPDCGYQGSFVVEADSLEDAKRIREELQADHEERDATESEESGTARPARDPSEDPEDDTPTDANQDDAAG